MTLQIFTWYNCRSLEALTRVAIHRSESFMRPFRAMQVPPRIAPCFTRPRRSEASHVLYSHRAWLLGFKASGLSALAATTGRYLNANDSLTGSCELCGLDRDLTVHHLVPKVHWRRMRKKRQVTGKDELGPKKPLRSWFQSHEASKSLALQDLSASAFEKTSTSCFHRTCHSMVHRTFSHSELGRHFNSIEARSKRFQQGNQPQNGFDRPSALGLQAIPNVE